MRKAVANFVLPHQHVDTTCFTALGSKFRETVSFFLIKRFLSHILVFGVYRTPPIFRRVVAGNASPDEFGAWRFYGVTEKRVRLAQLNFSAISRNIGLCVFATAIRDIKDADASLSFLFGFRTDIPLGRDARCRTRVFFESVPRARTRTDESGRASTRTDEIERARWKWRFFGWKLV